MSKHNFTPFKKLTIAVITLSDRASKGEYADLSGPEIISFLQNELTSKNWDFDIEYYLIPDEPEKLREILVTTLNNKVDAVFTTGGTGISPRDITPDVAREFIQKELPGIMENIRVTYGRTLPNALLSRGVAGVSANTQIYTLPGSVKAIRDYMTEILKTFEHLVFMLHQMDIH